MTPDEIQKLLGGYATGTLTDAEQHLLFEAALENQELFDALAREQPLRDLLHDPAARAHLLASIDERPQRRWSFGNRWVWAGATLAACLAVAGVFITRPKPMAQPVLVAESRLAAPPQPVAPPAATPEPAATAPATAPRKSAAPRRPPAKPESPAAESMASLDAVPPPPAPVVPPSATAPAAIVSGANASPINAPVPQSAKTPVEVKAADANLTVSNSMRALGAQSARALFYAPPEAAGSQFLPAPTAPQAPRAKYAARAGVGGALPVPNLGVKWSALRKQADGTFSEVDPEQIQAGDTIKLRLVPNDNGFLSVFDGTKPIVARQRAERLQAFETPEITNGAGTKELTVMLARQPQPAAANLVRSAAVDQLSTIDHAEHAVYEVKTGNNLEAPVLVKVTLNFR